MLKLYHPLQSVYQQYLSNKKCKQFRKSYQCYAGSGFTCNVCAAQYTTFVPDHPTPENAPALLRHNVIAGYGDHIICPNCLSNARERLVLAILQNRNDIKGKKILHLSPEKNIYQYINNRATVVTADLIPGFYASIDPNIQQQDATHLTYPDESFDGLIANHVLEHIPDDVKAMKEFFRVLKAGGSAILQVPYSTSIDTTIETPFLNDPVQQSALYGQKDHVRIYAIQDYCRRLQSVGFIVHVIEYADLTEFYGFAIQKNESFLEIKKPN